LAQRAVEKNHRPHAKHYVDRISRAFYLRGLAPDLPGDWGKRVMKKLLFGSIAFVALVGADAASAADMGLPVKGRMLEPEWNWSGFYAGLNAGYARGTTTWSDLDGAFIVGGSLTESTNAFTGGGQIGYNWQFRHAVVGFETDFNYLGLRQTTTVFALTAGAGTVPQSFHDALRWFGTVRGRAGLALDNVFTYVTAGLAYGKTNHNFNDLNGINHDVSATKVGFAAGVGAEYGLDPRWSVKAEALYVDLGKNSATVPGIIGSAPPTPGRFDINDTMWIVRAGVNYKFGG
jgi:outer membrane immunogenic protein